METNNDQLLTRAEAAEKLTISLLTLDKLAKKGLIEKIKLSPQAVRFSEVNLDSYIKSSRVS